MFLLEVAKGHFKTINEQVLPDSIALEFCREKKIYVVEDKKQKFGRLKFYRGYVFILINPKLNTAMRSWVIWHEIGHFILHAPESASFSPTTKRKNDREANYIAALALIPLHVVMFMTPAEIQTEYGYPMELIEIRLKICKKESN